MTRAAAQSPTDFAKKSSSLVESRRDTTLTPAPAKRQKLHAPVQPHVRSKTTTKIKMDLYSIICTLTPPWPQSFLYLRSTSLSAPRSSSRGEKETRLNLCETPMQPCSPRSVPRSNLWWSSAAASNTASLGGPPARYSLFRSPCPSTVLLLRGLENSLLGTSVSM